MAIKCCPILSTGDIPALLPASGIQRTPHLLHHGLQTAQPSPGHASLSAVTHHPHRKELVHTPFFFLLLTFQFPTPTFPYFFDGVSNKTQLHFVKMEDVKGIFDIFLYFTKLCQ